MKCSDVQDKFGEYWDLLPNDDVRKAVDKHLWSCVECTEQFALWEESEELIRMLSKESVIAGPTEHVNRDVMERIYKDQSWLMPVPSKSYQFSRGFRRNIAIVIAGCMAMFVCAFFISIFDNQDSGAPVYITQVSGLMDTANASSDFTTVSLYSEVPVASISDPFVLKVVPDFPQYYVAMSLLGLVMALMLLNWLSRTRS